MNEGIQTQRSAHSVDDTVARLQAAFASHGVKLFALVDHSGEALTAGFNMPPTKLLIFGNPKAGTPLMLAAPSTALDLPLRILVAEQPDGAVLISWNDPAWLQQRHGFPQQLMANVGAAELFAKQAAS